MDWKIETENFQSFSVVMHPLISSYWLVKLVYYQSDFSEFYIQTTQSQLLSNYMYRIYFTFKLVNSIEFFIGNQGVTISSFPFLAFTSWARRVHTKKLKKNAALVRSIVQLRFSVLGYYYPSKPLQWPSFSFVLCFLCAALVAANSSEMYIRRFHS